MRVVRVVRVEYILKYIFGLKSAPETSALGLIGEVASEAVGSAAVEAATESTVVAVVVVVVVAAAAASSLVATTVVVLSTTLASILWSISFSDFRICRDCFNRLA